MGVTIEKKQKKPAVKHSLSIKAGALSDETKEALQTAVGHVFTEYKDGSGQESSEAVAEVYGKGPFANVGVSAGRTVNLGNFNNVKITVSLFMPSPPSESAVNETFEFTRGWVDGKMQEIVSIIEDPESDSLKKKQ